MELLASSFKPTLMSNPTLDLAPHKFASNLTPHAKSIFGILEFKEEVFLYFYIYLECWRWRFVDVKFGDVKMPSKEF